jgi:NAD(P)-dependent dehydrogenase (short-subunit alcohol dehydrogenase family)
MIGETVGRLEHKIWVVTGAASGIGRAIAESMASEGATVVGLDVDVIEAAGVEPVRCDVTIPANVDAAISLALERHGRVDVLVNAAGIYRPGTVASTEPEDWDAVIAVDLRGPYLVSRSVLPGMIARRSGAIVHIASVAGLVGGRDSAAYIASKGGLVALTRAMALDHADHGIRVNCVCPGMVSTPMLWRTEEAIEPSRLEQARAERVARHPIGRLGVPSDIVPAVRFLATDDASWVTGSILTIDGGYTAG